jgi:tight adherence protein C
MILIAILALLLSGATVTLLAWASVLPRVHATQRLGQISAYGSMAEAGAEQAAPQASSAVLDGVAHRVGSMVARRLGARDEPLRRHLMAAGVYRLSPTALAGYRALAALTLPALLAAGAPDSWTTPVRIAVAVFAGWAGWSIPLVLLKRRARARLEAIDYALPGMIDVLVVTVEAGLGFGKSMQIAAEKLQGPLGDEIRLMLHEQRMGLGTTEALRNMGARADSAGMRTFVRAIVQGEQLGVSIGQIMRALAVDMRKLRRAMAEQRANKAPVKMLFPLVFLIFPALFILLLGPAALDLAEALGSASGR